LLSHVPAQLAAAALITSLAFAVIGRLRFIVISAAVAAWNLGAAAFQAFLHDTGLRDTRRGRGVQPTWPAWLPLAQVPIDHALVSAGVRVHARFVGGRVGSDRLPIVRDFSLDLP
jgi:endonuclease/exonuclease/phosphatase family metal-dependent hydrolase